MHQKVSPVTTINSAWFSEPSRGHLVQFYRSDDKLLDLLFEFMYTGLNKNEDCIVIATPFRIHGLNERLKKAGVNISDVQSSGQIMLVDAAETLSKFMVNGLPDKKLFMDTVRQFTGQNTKRGKPVRVYGEMVALLWKEGYEEAVIALEELWNKLGDKNVISLFCAYPDLHFILDKEAKERILLCHSAQYPSVPVAQH